MLKLRSDLILRFSISALGGGNVHPYWAEYNIPFLVNQSGGGFIGRNRVEPDVEVSKEFRWEDDSFQDSFRLTRKTDSRL